MRIYNNRNDLYQWDSNQYVVHNFGIGDEVHFFNMTQPNALTVRAFKLNGEVVAEIPNILLQSSYPIYVYWMHIDNDGQYTKEEFVFKVKQRPKPAGYIYTETEVLSYEYLDKRLDRLEGEGLKEALAAYLEEHPLEESDPTVPEWAKQPEKPEYTAKEVGAVGKDELPEAINEALAEAKASGQFDGADGKDGYTPVKGKDYFDGKDGKDYVLTDEDKSEIAEMAAELVDVPEGSGAVSGTLLPETEISQEGRVRGFGYDSTPVGAKVAVIIDGTPYVTTHNRIGEGADAIDYIGNIVLLSPDGAGTEYDTGEPFLAFMYSDFSDFFFADGASHKVAICTVDVLDEVYVNALNSIGNMSGGSGNFVVELTTTDGENFTANKTYEEIVTAWGDGLRVLAMMAGEPLTVPLTGLDIDKGDLFFELSAGIFEGAEMTAVLTCSPGNEWSLIQKAIPTMETVERLAGELMTGVPKVLTASVGQTIKVKSVDDNGVPTAWEAVDFPSGGNVDYVGVEPAEDDIPKFFYGGNLPQTKDDAVMSIRYISKTEDISGYCETKAQGNSSMSFPKKNQTTKFYKDAACTEKLKVDFKGWGKQRKFCFKANWIDITQARNIVSARLWGDVVRSRANYMELPELLRTSPNQGAVDGFPVKVYANGVYQGRYTINIPKDAWMANMDDENEKHCILCSENYGSGCFRALAKIDESDWTDEVHETVPESIKTRWNEVISFVMNSTDEEFKANLGNYFFVDSLIDYDLYALASCGLDAMGKNQLFMTYDGQKWIASMYDMDSTWGLYWNGSKFVATDYARTSYEDFANGRQGNLLYIRLEQLFSAELQTRWAGLKSGALSIENIINRFERFTDIAPAELVKEDYASTTGGGAFTGIPSKDTNNVQQIRSFALARLAWTDAYVSALTGGGEQPDPEEPDKPDNPEPTDIPCTGITLNKSALTFNGDGTQTLTAAVEPTDTTDGITWNSNSPFVATVDDGVVTAKNNGSAIITAKCGTQKATCIVSVSGIVDESIVYSLENETSFDGATTYIDTGIQLFDTDKDFSIFIDIKAEEGNKATSSIVHCMREQTPWPGLAIQMKGISSGSAVVGSIDTTRTRVILTHAADSGIVNVVKNNGVASNYAINLTIDEITQNVLLGCGQDISGNKQFFWKGTMYTCDIHNRVLSDDEIHAKLGFGDLTVFDSVVWSETNDYKLAMGANRVEAGSDYVTPNMMELPEHVSTMTLKNVGTGAYTYLKIVSYDENMDWLGQAGDRNSTDAINYVVNSTAKYFRLSAYPSTADCTDPANQLELSYTTNQLAQ